MTLLAARCLEVNILQRLVRSLPPLSGGYVSVLENEKVTRLLYSQYCTDLKSWISRELSHVRTEKSKATILAISSHVVFRPTTDCVLYVGLLGKLIPEKLHSCLADRGWVPQDLRPDILVLDLAMLLYENETSYSIVDTVNTIGNMLIDAAVSDTCVGILQLRECCTNMFVTFISKDGSLKLYEVRTGRESIVLTLPARYTRRHTIARLVETCREINTRDNAFLVINVKITQDSEMNNIRQRVSSS